MPDVTISKKDILAKTKVDAKWYVLEVTAIDNGWIENKNGNEMISADFTIKAPTHVGVSWRHFFFKGQLGTNFDTLVPFLESFLPPGQNIQEGSFNTGATKGKLFEAFCFYTDEGDFPGNKIKAFRRHSGQQQSTKTA